MSVLLFWIYIFALSYAQITVEVSTIRYSNNVYDQQTNTWSKLTTETLEKGLKYVQS